MKLHQIIAEADDHIDYTGIDPNVIQQLSTYKPHYQQWAIEQIRKGENYNSIIDAVDYYITKISDNRFQNILKKHTPSSKNILSLSLDNIKTAQRDFEATYNRLSRRERNKLKSNVLVDRPDLKIVKFEKSSPGDVDAAKALSAAAQNTQWCVCNVETAENYLKQGPLYLLTVDGERYLCHVKSNQLMDVDDEPKKFPERFCIAVVKYIPGFGIFCDDIMSNIYKQSIIHNPESVYYYARWVIKGRWPEAEPTIMQEPQSVYKYSVHIIKGRWPEAEPTIMKDPHAYWYARNVIRGRWPEAEPYIMQDPELAYKYARDVVKGRWPEAEPHIIRNPEWACEYAINIIKGRWPAIEPILLRSPIKATIYCQSMEMRIPKLEPTILKNPRAAYDYARYVINGRWPQAEPIILNSKYKEKYEQFIKNKT